MNGARPAATPAAPARESGYDYEHLVTFAETNLVGNVYFAHYLHWQGHCRERFLFDRAPGLADRLTRDLALVTVSCGCEFLAELYAGDLVRVRMKLGALTAERVTMHFDYFRVSGALPRLVARGSQTVACLRRAAGGGGPFEPIAVPDELLAALAPFRD